MIGGFSTSFKPRKDGEIGAVHGPEIRWEYKDLMEIMKAGTVGG